ncbi:MAG: HlyD family type I secretion periplasmic adaptor subunit [Epsilonproteobacteria bacterium]|nr:HlyD family type I secretion periplasmic adaptor subunit [Campylobacterota bacterium]
MHTTDDKNRFKPHLAEIEDSPISPLGRKILWTILIFMVLAVIWLFVGKTDVVVSARAEAAPIGNVKILQALGGGAVRAIHIKEGDIIKQGDPLIEIDPTVEESNIEAKKKNLQILELETQKLNALINNSPFIIPSNIDPSIAVMISGMHRSEKESIEEEQLRINQQMRQIAQEVRTVEIDRNRASQIHRMGKEEERKLRQVLDIIAKNEYYTLQKENIGYQNEINRKSHEIQRLKEQLHELKIQKSLISKNFHSRLYESLTQKNRELYALRSEIEAVEFKKQKQVIVSPVDGIVAKLALNTLGGVVSPAEKLMTIVPNGIPIQIKATVANKDIGFIKRGMPVAIKIDTFDYQKYGLLDGNVTKISANAIEDEQLGLVYEVFIKPSEAYLTIEGEKRPLLPGMSATAELKVGQRRIIEFFIYPLIKYMDEGVSVR